MHQRVHQVAVQLSQRKQLLLVFRSVGGRHAFTAIAARIDAIHVERDHTLARVDERLQPVDLEDVVPVDELLWSAFRFNQDSELCKDHS